MNTQTKEQLAAEARAEAEALARKTARNEINDAPAVRWAAMQAAKAEAMRTGRVVRV